MNVASWHNVILKLWRGQYGLARTWWLFGVLGTALLNLVSGPLNALLAASTTEGISGAVLIVSAMIVAVIGVCYGIVVTVGTIRAANAYRGKRIWSWLAIIVTAVAWISAVTYVAL
ncbi:MAG: hypothetical protein J4G19_05070 [Pseudomonadales bacterium]|nr:hypothetical protein [Pseudomonadales bacterium]